MSPRNRFEWTFWAAIAGICLLALLARPGHATGDRGFIGRPCSSIAPCNDSNVQISTAGVVSGQFGDNRVAISTAGVVSGQFGDGRVAVSTAGVVSGQFGDSRIAASTAAIISGQFSDSRVAITTAGVVSGQFGDSRVAISTAAVNNGSKIMLSNVDNAVSVAQTQTASGTINSNGAAAGLTVTNNASTGTVSYGYSDLGGARSGSGQTCLGINPQFRGCLQYNDSGSTTLDLSNSYDSPGTSIQMRLKTSNPAASITVMSVTQGSGFAIRGSTDGSSTSAGFVGEYISTTATGNINFSPSGVAQSIATTTLLAGDWLCSGTCAEDLGATTAQTDLACFISKTANSNDVATGDAYSNISGVGSVNQSIYLPVGPRRISTAVTIPLFLTSSVAYSVAGGGLYTGARVSLRCWRIR